MIADRGTDAKKGAWRIDLYRSRITAGDVSRGSPTTLEPGWEPVSNLGVVCLGFTGVASKGSCAPAGVISMFVQRRSDLWEPGGTVNLASATSKFRAISVRRLFAGR